VNDIAAIFELKFERAAELFVIFDDQKGGLLC
jgi:hypothetical protein